MSAVLYHQVIDPAISGSQDTGMPPPPIPSAKSLRGQAGPPFSRRASARRTSEGTLSIRSAAITDAFSSQLEPQSQSMSQLPTQDEPF